MSKQKRPKNTPAFQLEKLGKSLNKYRPGKASPPVKRIKGASLLNRLDGEQE